MKSRTDVALLNALRGSVWVVLLTMLIIFLTGPAASAAPKIVGIIMTGNIPYYKDVHKSFTETLASEGFGPGSVETVIQTPSPETMSWTNAARKLVTVGSTVIVSYGAPATIFAMSETSDIPIVFAGVYDPQAVGVTGKNATGISSKVPVASIIKNLKSISNFSTLGVIFNDSEKDTVVQANDVKQLEGTYGFKSTRFNIKKASDTAKIANVEALFLTTGCAAMHCVSNITGVARKAKVPTAATIAGGETQGVILTIAADPHEQGREAAKIVAKILRGAKPASIPIEQPKKIDVIINLREATDMGLKVPFDLLTSATKVIK
ncbi:MAG: ABC transporter substrate-binding protein [Thermodesulfovibrionales bacterium]